MDIYNIFNLKLESVVKVKNKETVSGYMQYGKDLKFYQLIYVLSGEAKVVFNETVIENKSGRIVFLPKGTCSEYRAKITQEEECIGIFFEADFPAPPELFTCDFSKNTKIADLFQKLYRIWVKKQSGYYNECMSIFYSILSEMERSSQKYIPNYKRAKITKAIEYIHEHYTESEFEYERLHTLCGISYTYFKKLFKEVFCTTPSSYVRILRIQRACELLTTNKFPITQVAKMCGFEDICYFSKVFKNEIGISPAAFRNAQK